MKILGIASLLLFLTIDMLSGPPPQALWRWRNDDGDIYSATWRDSANVPVVYRNEGNIRLRLLIGNGPGRVTLRYSRLPYSNYGDEPTITSADTGAVHLSASDYIVDQGRFMDNRMLPASRYPLGMIYGGTLTFDSTSACVLPNSLDSAYEIEYCLKPGSRMPPGTVLYFRYAKDNRVRVEQRQAVLQFPPVDWQDISGPLFDGVPELFFVDEMTGWRRVFVSSDTERTFVLERTRDGGRRWERVQAECGPVYCLDGRNVWALFQTDGRWGFHKTTDGGKTWEELSSFDPSANPPSVLYFVTPQCGWIDFGRKDSLARTTDGGSTWVMLRKPDVYFHKLFFVNEMHGFAYGEKLFRTRDGGLTWEEKGLFAGDDKICFVDTATGWASRTNGAFLRTDDGGESWQDQAMPVGTVFYAIHFADRQHGWAAGDYGTIVATRDGGAHWTEQMSGTRYRLKAISAVNDHVWIAGEEGIFLTSQSGGWTPVEVKSETRLPEKFTLSPNYPNPFNPSTTIRYALPRASHVRVTIFDLLGREIETLVNERKPAGVHEEKWNASHHASGVYICRLTAEGYMQARMMALVK